MKSSCALFFWRLPSTVTFWLALGSLATCWAYNPPVDRDGPLTVRIVAPEVVTQTEKPIAVRVVLKNHADQQLAGRLALKVIDCWQTEPGASRPFTIPAESETTHDFLVMAGAGTHSAHYPIHAIAAFTWEGQQRTAHPILVVETRLPKAEREIRPLDWKPVTLAADRSFALSRFPVFRAVILVFQQPPQIMKTGWTGAADTNRSSIQRQGSVRLDGQVKSAIAIHPPWHAGQVGAACVEYPLSLPRGAPIKLRFATAVTPTGDGDGVTFRVRIASLDAPAGKLGAVAFERHSAAKLWQAGEADLSRFAGQSIRLQLESHPGPRNDTRFDQSYWAEPTLIVGQPVDERPFPPLSLNGSQPIGTIGSGATRYDVYVWPGQRGLLDARVGIVKDNTHLCFRGFRIRVLGERIDDSTSPTALVTAIPEACPGGHQVRHRFASVYGSFDVVGRLIVDRGALRANFRLENAPPRRPWLAPRIEELSVDEFDAVAHRVYAGHGNVIQDPPAFRLAFDGHRLATSHVGFDFPDGISLLQTVDLPPDSLEVDPDRHHYSLHAVGDATLSFIPAPTTWQAVKQYRETNGLKAAGGVKRLAGRFVFDLWGGRYGESGDQLARAFCYGMTDAAVVWHNWQRWGYDYRLPEIYPPNPQWGTEDELKKMIACCSRAGVLFALHDNYIDMYPDAQGFSYRQNIAFHENGTPVKAWLNKWRNARSYRYRTDRVEPFLKGNLQTLAKNLRPTAYFIDVWSSIGPYDYWTADGQFFDRVSTRDTWGRHFAWIRGLLGDHAPQISESGHDQLIGWLDGAQTNHLRVGTPLPGDRDWCVWNIRCDDAERIPWFDAAHHDRFVLHGAGYSSRYEAGLDRRLHGIFSDDYLCTEVLTGHPAMVSRPFGREVVRKYWLTQDLMRALAMRTIEDVAFVDDNLHRQHIRWSGDGEVWVNRGEDDWEVADHTLPQYGFLARVPTADGTVVASIHRRDGLIVEQAVSPHHFYVNGRHIVDGVKRIRPTVSGFENQGPRRANLSVIWQADDPIPDGYRPFIHFVDDGGEIMFQGGFHGKLFADRRSGRIVLPATVHVPDNRKPGEKYELRVGLYNPQENGRRLNLIGENDGEQRYRQGEIEIVGEGETVTSIRWTPRKPGPDPYRERRNPGAKPVDFGAIVTSGGYRLSREADSLLVIPLPESGAVRGTCNLRWRQLPWKLPQPDSCRGDRRG